MARLRRWPQLRKYADSLPFEMDDFQREACQSLEDGHAVLVAAPTSAGKTVVGEFAVFLSLAENRKAFYTTPIKALSNQKFNEFRNKYGQDRVGLLTGDNSINGEASIVVMTTEVLRNMIYERSSTLTGLAHVILDEVHYLADRSRGAVWEETIIHLPPSVTITALSATVSNAEEFGDWLRTVRGDTKVVLEEQRPVPLHQHVLVGRQLYDLRDARGQVLPDLLRIAQNERSAGRHRQGRSRYSPKRSEVASILQEAALLPAIYFVFSRAGCDDAVEQLLSDGICLLDSTERQAVREVVARVEAQLPPEDLRILGFASWAEGLSNGIAAHHAGLLPIFKETVEQLFLEGLVRLVFATETLALGINMPARSVVLEKLVKFNGESHVELSPGEYTQLTGRAGRRGIDVEGHAIVAWHQGLDPRALSNLTSARTFPLKSSFRPTYNMAVNLISRVGPEVARELLETSFAQFQADRAVVGLAKQLHETNDDVSSLASAATCHLGDFAAYMQLREQISRAEKDSRSARTARNAAVSLLASAARGSVIGLGKRRRAVVLDEAREQFDPRPRVLDDQGRVQRLSADELMAGAAIIGSVQLPAQFDSRKPANRKWLANQLHGVARDWAPMRIAADDVDNLRRKLRAHPCHGCHDREAHARAFLQSQKLGVRTEQLSKSIDRRTNSIAVAFDRLCQVLIELGYLTEDMQVTQAGHLLRRIYGELDLLTAELLRRGALSDLPAPLLASVASTLVFEARGDHEPRQLPARIAQPISDLFETWGELVDLEQQFRVPALRPPDEGLAGPMLIWTEGQDLPRALRNSDLAPGDFVRWAKSLTDLLGQIGQTDVPTSARAAADRVNRGIVAW